MMRRAGAKILLVLLLLSSALSGCAWRNREHTPLFNACEKYLVPKTQPARGISFPVSVPVCLSAVTVDLLLVHPVMELPKAYDDTKDALWDLHWRDWKGDSFSTSALLPLRVAVTPVMFAGDWLGRSVVGSDGKGRSPGKADSRRDDAAERLRGLAEKKNRAGFLAAADNVCPAFPDLPDCRKAECLRMFDGRQFDRMGDGRCGWQETAWRDEDIATLAATLRTGEPAERAAVLAYMAGWQFPKALLSASPALIDAVGGLTVGADKALALQAVQLLAQCPACEGVASILSGVASGADPVLAYHASKALKRLPKK